MNGWIQFGKDWIWFWKGWIRCVFTWNWHHKYYTKLLNNRSYKFNQNQPFTNHIQLSQKYSQDFYHSDRLDTIYRFELQIKPFKNHIQTFTDETQSFSIHLLNLISKWLNSICKSSNLIGKRLNLICTTFLMI